MRSLSGRSLASAFAVVAVLTGSARGGEAVVAVNSGGGAFTAADGTVYGADSGYSGGSTYTTGDAISGTEDDALYQSERYGDFTYAFTLADGEYLVTLKFAEFYYASAGERVFDVLVEGSPVIDDLDIYAEVGHDAAHDVQMQLAVSDGQLDIGFQAISDYPKISAILVEEMVPAAPSITTVPATCAWVDVPYWYVIAASGSPFPTFGVAGLPGWLAFDGTDTISGTPGAVDVGATGTITATATNSQGTDAQEFEIAVSDEAGDGLRAAYYDSMAFTGAVLERVDPAVDFDWGLGSPDPAVGADTFSVVWTGAVLARHSAVHTFYTATDDGARLWVGGQVLVNQWRDQSTTEHSGEIALAAGVKYDVRMEYYENAEGATARLLWSSAWTPKEVVPQESLFSAPPGPLRITSPLESPVSPVWVEGASSGNAASVWVSVDSGTPFEAAFLRPMQWYADDPDAAGPLGIPLTALAPSAEVLVTSWDADDAVIDSITRTITWTATDLAETSWSSDSVTIRKGDWLLLMASNGNKIEGDGNGTFVFTGAPGAKYPVLYDIPGEFIVTAKQGGTVVGSLTVIVIEVSPISATACQVGFQREKDIEITPPEYAAEVHFGAANPALLEVSVKEYAATGATVHLEALARGTPVLAARIGGAAGPIITTKDIDEFTLDVPARCCVLVNDDTDVGASKLTVRPHIPNLDFEFDMFMSQSTFLGGATFFTINTSDVESSLGEPGFEPLWDETTGETVGEFLFSLEVPDTEPTWACCMNIIVRQASSPEWKEIAREDGVNAKICKARVVMMSLCYGQSKNLYVITRSKIDTTRQISVVDDGDSISGPPTFTGTTTVVCQESTWEPNPPLVQKFPVTGGADPGIYDIMIGNTTFGDKIYVPNYPIGIQSTRNVGPPILYYGTSFQHTLIPKDPAFGDLDNSDIDIREDVVNSPNYADYGLEEHYDSWFDIEPGNKLTPDQILTRSNDVDPNITNGTITLPGSVLSAQAWLWKNEDEDATRFRAFDLISIVFTVTDSYHGESGKWAITTDNDIVFEQLGQWP